MLVIDKDICNKCEECKEVCACDAIETKEDGSLEINAQLCIDCDSCVVVCPFEAISNKDDD